MLTLKIVSPEKIEFEGKVESVNVPGTQGRFEILTGHAPIISTLMSGKVEYKTEDATHELLVTGGFVEVQKNVVSLCVEKG